MLPSWRCRSKTRHTAIPLLSLRLKKHLDPKFLAVLVEPSPKPSLSPIHFPRLQFESTGLIWFCCHKQVLIILVRWIFHLLFERRHEPDPRHHAGRNLWILKLKEQAHLPGQRVPSLRNLVTWPANLHHVPSHLHPHIHAEHIRILRSPLLLLPRCPPGQVGLMLATLCVSEIGAIVLMYREAESTFEGADVVLEEVRVFVEIDGFEGKFAETLPAVGVGGRVRCDPSAAKF